MGVLSFDLDLGLELDLDLGPPEEPRGWRMARPGQDRACDAGLVSGFRELVDDAEPPTLRRPPALPSCAALLRYALAGRPHTLVRILSVFCPYLSAHLSSRSRPC